MPLETYQRREDMEQQMSKEFVALTLSLLRKFQELYALDGYQPTIDLVIDDLEGVMKRFNNNQHEHD